MRPLKLEENKIRDETSSISMSMSMSMPWLVDATMAVTSMQSLMLLLLLLLLTSCYGRILI